MLRLGVSGQCVPGCFLCAFLCVFICLQSIPQSSYTGLSMPAPIRKVFWVLFPITLAATLYHLINPTLQMRKLRQAQRSRVFPEAAHQASGSAGLEIQPVRDVVP